MLVKRRLVLHAYICTYPALCVCVCVVFECMWLLRLSSVRALKVGPDFTVISHPNGSCHILLPTRCWRTTKSQEEKRKLNRRSICLVLSLRTKVTPRFGEETIKQLLFPLFMCTNWYEVVNQKACYSLDPVRYISTDSPSRYICQFTDNWIIMLSLLVGSIMCTSLFLLLKMDHMSV